MDDVVVMPPRERLVRIAEAARFIGVHPNTLRKWTNAGVIRHYRMGTNRHRYFDKIDLAEYLTTHRRGVT